MPGSEPEPPVPEPWLPMPVPWDEEDPLWDEPLWLPEDPDLSCLLQAVRTKLADATIASDLSNVCLLLMSFSLFEIGIWITAGIEV
ncbi:MAG: hypothetical protein JWP91_4506 [Fibrobacteres bacterium]|nr:hypothetical protein [Fibrobacterota bacterium]